MQLTFAAQLGLRLVSAIARSRAEYGFNAAAIRVVRLMRTLWLIRYCQRLSQNAACLAHLLAIASDDEFFWLSHRHYLATGFGPQERAELALSHYEHETLRLDENYRDAVYDGGLTLWHQVTAQNDYRVVLEAGNDTLHEGGLSLVFRIDGARIALLSFSWVPEVLVAGAAGAALVPFITRHQSTRERYYQKDFHKAFDRVRPVQLMLAALAGLCEAEGAPRILGLAARHHPSATDDTMDRYLASYDQTWEAQGGRQVSPGVWTMAVPVRRRPLEEIEPSRRKRTVRRRAHADAVTVVARETISRYLTDKGGDRLAP